MSYLCQKCKKNWGGGFCFRDKASGKLPWFEKLTHLIEVIQHGPQVFGPRYVKRRTLHEPNPIQTIRLVWSSAFVWLKWDILGILIKFSLFHKILVSNGLFICNIYFFWQFTRLMWSRDWQLEFLKTDGFRSNADLHYLIFYNYWLAHWCTLFSSFWVCTSPCLFLVVCARVCLNGKSCP